jgi:hypothetical protein
MVELMPLKVDSKGNKAVEIGASICRLIPGCNASLLVHSHVLSINGTTATSLPYNTVIDMLRDRTQPRNITFLNPSTTAFTPSKVSTRVKAAPAPASSGATKEEGEEEAGGESTPPPKPLIDRLVKYITQLNDRHGQATLTVADIKKTTELTMSVSKRKVVDEIRGLKNSMTEEPAAGSDDEPPSTQQQPAVAAISAGTNTDNDDQQSPEPTTTNTTSSQVTNAKLFLSNAAYQKLCTQTRIQSDARKAEAEARESEAASAKGIAQAQQEEEVQKQEVEAQLRLATARRIATAQAREQELTTLLTDAGKLIQTLQAQKEADTSRISELEINLHTQKESAHSKASTLSTLSASHAQVQNTLNELISETHTLESQKQDLRNLIASKDAHMESQRAEHKSEIDAKDARIKLLTDNAREEAEELSSSLAGKEEHLRLVEAELERVAAMHEELDEANESLSEQLAAKDSHLSEAMDTVIQLTEEKNAVASLMEGFRENAEEYKRMYENEISQNALLQENFAAAAPANAELASFNQSLNAENKQLLEKISSLEATVSEHEEDKDGMKKVVLMSEQERTKLQDEVEKLRAKSEQQVASLNGELAALKKKADHDSSELIKLQAHMEVESELLVHDTNKQQNQIKLWQTRCSEKEDELQEAVTSYEAQFDSVSSLVDNLKQQVDETQAERLREIAVWTEKCDLLEALVAEKEADISILTEELRSEKELHSSDVEQVSAQKEADLQSKKVEYEKLLEQVEALAQNHSKAIEKRDAEILALENAVEKQNVTVRHMELEIEELTEDKQSQIADLVAQVNTFEAQMKNQADARDMEMVSLDVNRKLMKEQMEDEKSDLIDRLADMEQEMAECRSREFMASEEIVVLKRELEQNDGVWKLKLQEAETRAFEAIDMCDEADKAVAGRNKMVEVKDEELWKLKEEMVAKEKEMAALVMHIELLDKKIVSMKALVAEQSEDIENQRQAAEKKGLQIKEMEKEQAKMEEERKKEHLRVRMEEEKKESAREEEAAARTRAAERTATSHMQQVLQDMQARNESLEGELSELRAEKMNASTSSGSSSSSSAAASPVKRVALSPTFNSSLIKTHDECMSALHTMKKHLVEELTPSKKRKATTPTLENKRKDMVLKRLQSQVDGLLDELLSVKGTLEERDGAIAQMADAIAALEEDRLEYQAELQAQDKFVQQAGEMVERELAWRKQAEAQFEEVRGEISNLESENNVLRVSLRVGAGKIDDDWKERVDSMRIVTKSIGTFLGAAGVSERRVGALSRGFFKWREHVRSHGESADKGDMDRIKRQLDAERRLNSDLLSLNSVNVANHEQRMMLLEEENESLKGEIGVLSENSQMLLDAGREMREEVEFRGRLGEGLGLLRGVLAKGADRRVGKMFRRWAGAGEFDRGLKQGKGESEARARQMEEQLQGTKVKLMALKGALRDGGYIAKTPQKGSREGSKEELVAMEALSAADSFCWELSSDDGSEA